MNETQNEIKKLNLSKDVLQEKKEISVPISPSRKIVLKKIPKCSKEEKIQEKTDYEIMIQKAKEDYKNFKNEVENKKKSNTVRVTISKETYDFLVKIAEITNSSVGQVVDKMKEKIKKELLDKIKKL